MNKQHSPNDENVRHCVQQFNRFFTIHLANTKALKNAVYHIRHQVFNQQQNSEKQNTEQLEYDHYDEFAQHIIIEHKRSGMYAGCARLILPEVNLYSANFPFCQFDAQETRNGESAALNENSKVSDRLNGEISKVVVLPQFRRSSINAPVTSIHGLSMAQVFSIEERQSFAHINLALIVSALALAKLNHLNGLFMFTDQRMFRYLQRIGLDLTSVSENLNYYGGKSLYFLPKGKFKSDLTPLPKQIFDHLYPQLKRQFETDMSFPYADLQVATS